MLTYILSEYGALRDGSIPSCCSSTNSVDKVWSPPPNQKDDLYAWMAKQHNGNKDSSAKENPRVIYFSFSSN